MRNLKHLNNQIVQVKGTLAAITARELTRSEFFAIRDKRNFKCNCFMLKDVTVDGEYFDHIWVKYFKDELGVKSLSAHMGRILDIDAKCFMYTRRDGTVDFSFKEASIVDII